ncbi:MAG: peptidoglycan editing factor PgeF [Anaerolineales bacterium]
MRLQRNRELVYYRFPQIPDPPVVHGIFTRLGGASGPPWDSLNLGGTVGDDPKAVRENLERLLSAVGGTQSQLAQVKQVHSAEVVKVDRPMDDWDEADAMITSSPGILLLMRFADCVPILYYDQDNRAVGIAHAGWQGTLKGIAKQVVLEMEHHFGTDPGNLFAGIGPSIGPDHYQVGSDVRQLAEEVFGDRAQEVLIENGDDVKLDLWRANQINLEDVGVGKIDVSGICTGCHLDHWYSHRAEHGKTGRFAAVIGIS